MSIVPSLLKINFGYIYFKPLLFKISFTILLANLSGLFPPLTPSSAIEYCF